MKEKSSPVETALKILSRKRLSTRQLREKMTAKQFGAEEIEQAVSYLTESHYLNDDELLSDYITFLVEKKKYGPERIAAYLAKKGFEKQKIRERISQLFDEEDLIENAITLIGKKLRNTDPKDTKAREKTIRILSYNGYNWDLIERIINR